jgi:thymidine kinase
MKQGRLEVVCGPMFAGKSTRLLARCAELAAAGLAVQAFKPARDDRYDGARHIVTHDGRRLEARPVVEAAEVLAADAPAVLIDEVHFFGDAIVEPCMRLVQSGRVVIVAGVDRDHRGRPFAPFPALLCEADRVDKLHATCARCGGAACHSQRLVDSDAHIVVGGPEAYEPRCRSCFRPAP